MRASRDRSPALGDRDQAPDGRARPGDGRPPAALPDLPATGGERRAAGKAARKRAGRGTLGHWAEDERGHDALETILAQNQIRVPGLVPIRHQRMAVSPWNYYRGAAAVMAGDLASQPDSGLTVQLCGDAHVLNFGLWATPERNLAFDLRDFDETLPGPFEWDVKRFAASLVVAARENRLKPARAAAAVTAGLEAYRRRMRRYTAMPELDIWYDAHPRRQPDRLLRAGRPRAGLDPHREEAEAPHQPRGVRQAHHDGARAAADNRRTPRSASRSATTSRPISSATSWPGTG